MTPAIPPSSARKKAFLAEDALDVRAALTLLLENTGFEVTGSASTEAEALAWLAQNPDEWHVAVIDLLLLEGSGFNVLRRFKETTRDGKVVVFSGFVSEPVRLQCERLGADAVIAKSDGAQLVRLLDAFVAGS